MELVRSIKKEIQCIVYCQCFVSRGFDFIAFLVASMHGGPKKKKRHEIELRFVQEKKPRQLQKNVQPTLLHFFRCFIWCVLKKMRVGFFIPRGGLRPPWPGCLIVHANI
jgi:hypothetical protein